MAGIPVSIGDCLCYDGSVPPEDFLLQCDRLALLGGFSHATLAVIIAARCQGQALAVVNDVGNSGDKSTVTAIKAVLEAHFGGAGRFADHAAQELAALTKGINNGSMIAYPPGGGATGAGGGAFSGEAEPSALSQLTDTVSNLDPLAAMEKSLQDTMGGMSSGSSCVPPQGGSSGGGNSHTMPHTPMTPGSSSSATSANGSAAVTSSAPSAAGGTPTSTSGSGSAPSDSQLPDLSGQLHFDPSAIVEGDSQGGPESLDLYPDNSVDPLELLSFLEPEQLGTPPSSGGSTQPPPTTSQSTTSSAATAEEILSLFE